MQFLAIIGTRFDTCTRRRRQDASAALAGLIWFDLGLAPKNKQSFFPGKGLGYLDLPWNTLERLDREFSVP
jgi:hypothetical protein